MIAPRQHPYPKLISLTTLEAAGVESSPPAGTNSSSTPLAQAILAIVLIACSLRYRPSPPTTRLFFMASSSLRRVLKMACVKF
jgi:hypothetical protein